MAYALMRRRQFGSEPDARLRASLHLIGVQPKVQILTQIAVALFHVGTMKNTKLVQC